MCGILGYVATAGRPLPDPPVFAHALDMLARRGPDDQGVWRDTQAALGHRRLSILDLSQAGHQPMLSRDGRYVIVFNGEVYNFLSLRAQFEGKGARFATRTDTEVILELFALEGPAAIERLRGMFALAIWDVRERRLFLVRDRLGIKPLYVWQADGAIAFASELKALRAIVASLGAVSRDGLFDFMTWGSVRSPRSILEGARCLPPGSWLEWRDSRADERRFWRVPTPPTSTRYRRRSEVLEVLRPALREAVALRCIADVPVGAFLSGGIDSSAIVALMREAEQQDIRTLSVTFPGTSLDESAYAAQIAAHFATEHIAVPASSDFAARLLDDFLAVMDQPTCDGLNVYLVSQLAKQAGLTVALSGLGGDELFGGYHTFDRAAAVQRWGAWIPRLARHGVGMLSSKVLPRLAKLEAFALPGSLQSQAYFVSRGLFSPRQAAALLADEWRAAPEATAHLLPSHTSDAESFQATMELELGHYMHNQLLRDSDVFGMAHGLEIRVPLIDHQVVEIIAQTEPALVRHGRNKQLLRDALPSPLPQSVVDRRKMGFTFPFAQWVRTAWRKRIEATLLRPSSFLRLPPRRRVWEDFLQGRIHWSRPWSLYVLLSWLERNGHEV